MANILDADSAYLKAKQRLADWQASFLARWMAPIDEVSLLVWWHSQPPAVLESMRATNPEAFAIVEAKVKLLEERSRPHAY